MKYLVLFLLLPLLNLSCYYVSPSDNVRTLGEGNVDSITFYQAHHYWKGANFVAVDSFSLSPTMPTSIATTESILGEISVIPQQLLVTKGLHLVIADVRFNKVSPSDSIWLKVATEEAQVGWVSESILLKDTVPDHQISQFIFNFSNNSVLFLLTLLALGIGFLLGKVNRKRRFQMVHFNDINSFYPTALCLMVSLAASLYGIMQSIVPHTWVEFYFHPTLNPFSSQIPFILRLFLGSFWGVLVLGVATLEEFHRRPEMKHRLTYLTTLMGICAILYVVFTLSMRFYIGYPLLLAYWYFAWQRYRHYRQPIWKCGNCGASISVLGTCPHCGVVNQ